MAQKYYRKMNKLLALLALTAVTSGAYAEQLKDSQSNSKFAVGAKIGTLGIGIEARMPIIEQFYGRLGVNYFDIKPK